MLLKFYGYYKQAVSGPCNTSRPSLFKVVERAKWDAWNSVKNLSKDEAMYNYIEEVKKIIETMPHNEHVQKLIEVIGPFFEYVNENEQLEEEQETEEDEEVATTTTINNDLNGSTYLIKSTTTMTESYDNIGKNMFDSFNSNNNNKLIPVNGNNGHTNGDLAKSNNDLAQTTGSDDEEDYCDTSDYLNEHDLNNQGLKKLNGTNANNDAISHEPIYTNNQTILRPKVLKNGYKDDNKLNGINDYNHNHLLLLNNSSCLSGIYGKSNLLNGDNQTNELDLLIHKLGGENMGGGGVGIPYQQSSLIRSSRPNSSLSNTGYSKGGGGSGGGGGGHNGGGGSGGGGSGGGGGNGNDGNNSFMSQESNRQILLLLLRLQQDTNNVLTRLSYLETTVMSIQVLYHFCVESSLI
jgi:acyl-CoA-binding protein